MAKRLKDAFNARWPTYVYKRRPNNSRRKRKKASDPVGADPRGGEGSRGVQKRGSFSSVGTISNITTFSSRPSTARSHSGQSAEEPPTTGASRVSTGHVSTMASQTSTPSVVQGAYSGYARPEGSGPSSWSWSSGSAIQHDLPVPATTSSASVPSMRRQSSQHNTVGVAPNGPPQFKHEEEEEVVYRSGNSPDTEHMWHGTGVSRGFNISDFQPQQRGDFNIADFQPRDNVTNDPNWISQFQISSSYPISGSHGTSSQSRPYSGGHSMPLPGFPSGSRGSFSSLNAIHNFGASSTSPQDRFAGNTSAPSASPGIETAGRSSYSFSSMNGSFQTSGANNSVTPPAEQPRGSHYFNGSSFQGTGVNAPVQQQGRSSLPNVLSIPPQGRQEDRTNGGYWSPHGEPPR
ncbi:hypothetical protein CALCODRAFT_51545 [Calocera cornea HHB12733]|uniref:Uncharacterized protein n=1 Tax=Calocera cornea HHB12733 TaxID=1353952 RepID=A0A165DSG7_9BASI|nr:hypothetical protein CALCODRAFT_51545 [Calocera cornea HHB12733]